MTAENARQNPDGEQLTAKIVRRENDGVDLIKKKTTHSTSLKRKKDGHMPYHLTKPARDIAKPKKKC